MSWFTSPSSIPVRFDHVAEDLDGTFTVAGQDPTLPHVRDAVNAGIQAASDLISSGALGTSGTFNVSIGGHANVDHKPDSPWVNDMISVSIYQVSPENG